MNHKLLLVLAASAATLTLSPLHGGLVVYEGFDYTDGSALAGEGAAVDGWSGAWTGGNWNVIPGQSFGSVGVTGGAVQRPSRSGNAATSRGISVTSQADLSADDSTIWFSVLLQATGSPASDVLSSAGFPTNTWGTIVFGDTALTGGSGGGPAPMGAGGNAIGVGFRGGNGASFDDVQVQGVIYNGGTVSTTTDELAPVIGGGTLLIVGSVEWAANGTEDTLTLYSVTDSTAAFLPTPFTTLTADLDQSSFSVISIGDAQTSIYDEIRFGTELEDVSPVGFSLNPPPTITASAELIGVGDSVDLDITFDTAADTAELVAPSGTVDLVALDNGSGGDVVAGDGQVTYIDSPTSSFNYEVETTKAGEVDLSAAVEVVVLDPASVPSNVFSTAILADSPLFYYRFEEPVGSGFLTDVSGNGNHVGSIEGDFTQGEEPGGMQLAGRSELTAAVEVPASSEMSASFTFTTVLNADDINGVFLRNVLAMTNGDGVGRSILYYSSNGFETFISGAGGGAGGGVALSDAGAVPFGISCLIHLVFDADPDEDPLTDDQELRLFVNGQPYGTPAVVGAVGANLGNWVLCSNKNLGNQSHVGWIDEAAVFESELSEAQIAAHGAAFFAAADPLLGFVSQSSEVELGDTVVLDWKISDQVTSVEIDGVPQTISGGGLYSTSFSNLTEDTTYAIEVFFAGGSVTSLVDVTVLAPPLPPEITSISTDTAIPPNVTIEALGSPNTIYELRASADLEDDFLEFIGLITTDGTGVGTMTFLGVGTKEFYRLETL